MKEIIFLVVLLIGYLIFAVINQTIQLKNIEEEAIRRGYAEMVAKTPTDRRTTFKWKD
jgi:hypothetical protein